MRGLWVRRASVACLWATLIAADVRAQDPQDQQQQAHDMSEMDMSQPRWTFMQDGVFNAVFNHQGGPRGGNEATAVNWWMGMLSHPAGGGAVTIKGMFSVEPATV